MAKIVTKRKRTIIIVRGNGEKSQSRTMYEVPVKQALALAVAAVSKEFPECLAR